MFSEKKTPENSPEPGTAQNRINEGTKLKGDVTSSGFFRIDGMVEGNVNTPSKVVIGKTGFVKGNLTCENADIEGKFEGNLKISGTLTLKSSALIEGDVIVGKLSVEPGATFNASCVMQGAESKKSNTQAIPPAEMDKTEFLKSQSHPFDRAQRAQKSKTEQPS